MTDIDIGYNLDNAGYLAGISQIEQANARVQQSIGSVTTTSTGLSRALGMITPGRATIAGMTLLAQQAAQAQQALSGLQATSTSTGVNVGKLAGGMRQMARDMPLGSTASRQVVEQFTKMGVASAGSEAKILKLATSVSKLSGATGEAPTQLAAGMTELARATGNTNLDPKRFESLGDSLTTVAAKGGASATSILAFSKSIAPMAQSAGIGATGVLGISTAFSRLGEDGLGASTAINKMLSDMNRAVREGSPEMKTYAQMAGKTTDEFQRLFKMNPAEALTQVTEAVAKAGPGGPRMLEQIGIEGVRGQRSLQALSASGGLRTQIKTATDAYGSGSTEEASKAAFGGLNDSMTKLGESTEQVAEALGAPLLGPLTLFTDGLNAATGGLAKLLNSGPVQAVMKGGVIAGIGALAVKSLIAPIGGLALGRQAATSGPIAAAVAAWLQTREGANQQGRLARFARPVAEAEAKLDPITGKSRLRSGTFGTTRGRAWDIAEGLAQSYNRKEGVGAFEDPNAPMGAMGPMTREEAAFEDARTGRNRPRRSKTKLAWSALHETAGTYMGMTAQQLNNAAERDQTKRDPSWGFTERVKRGWGAAQGAAGATDTGTWDAMKKGAGAFADTLTESSKTVKEAGKETATSFRDVAKAGGRVVGALGKDVKAGADIAAEKVGGWEAIGKGAGGALALTAATTLLTMGLDKAGSTQDRRESYLDRDISATSNALKESMGKATDATVTFGSTSEALQKQLIATAKESTWATAKEVTDEDIGAAKGSMDKVVNTYSGNPEQARAQLMAANPMGLPADELEAAQIDMLRQLSPTTVRKVFEGLPDTFEAGKTKGPTTPDINEITRSLVGQAENEPKNWYGGSLAILGGRGGPGGPMTDLDRSSKMSGFERGLTGAYGGRTDLEDFSDKAVHQMELLDEAIGQTFVANQKYGVDYAEQERQKQINDALKVAISEGSAEAFMAISQTGAMAAAGPEMKGKVWSPTEFEEAGGRLEDVIAKYDEEYANELKAFEERQSKAGGAFKPELIEQAYTKAIKGQSEFLGNIFDVRKETPAAKAMTASLGTPSDVKLAAEALNQVMIAAKNAAKPLDDLAVEAAKAAAALPEGSPEQERMLAVMQRAQFTQGAQGVFQGLTPGQTTNQQAIATAKMAQMPITNDMTRQQVEQAQQQTVAVDQANRARAAQRLMVERQRFIAESRAQEDFDRQQLYSKKDYELQVFRMERNFGIQRERQIESFNIQTERAEEDFATSRKRTLRDFATAALRAEQDYQTARARQIRDFNISLKRQIEDAAKSMYDPYDRIQTKATWDTANLLVNMQSQTDAMKKQKEQLDELRKLGLSAQTIDILGLGKAENAQQLNNIMADATPENIAALNAASKERAGAAGAMYTDASNTDLKRAREDLNKGLKDQEEDYLKSVKRSQADLAKSLKDSNDDFTKAMRRSSDDLKRNLRNAQDDLRTAMDDMATDRDTAMKRAETALGIQLTRMAEDIKEADMVIAGDMETLAEETNKAIHGKTVNWTKLMKNDTQLWLTGWKQDVIPQVTAAYKAMGITATDVSNASSPNPGNSTLPGSEHSRRATGGPIPGFSPHDKADNVHVMATAGEFMQPVKAVNYYGPKFMEDIRSLRFPREQAQHLATGGMVYKQMETWLHKNLPGVAVTSSYRPGAITALGNVSMHSQGKALDLAPSMNTFNKILGTFGKKIHQLFYSPADGRTILRGNPWRMDGQTKSDHWDHVHWAMQSMEGLAGLAGMSGMTPEMLARILKALPRDGKIQKSISDRVAIAFSRKMAELAQAGGGASGGPDYQGEDAVARWSGEVKNVLRMLSRPMSEEGAVLRRIEQESSGNPRAINNWDSNAKRGTPSKGLMQVIDPTFRAYRGRSLPNNIYDPMANIYAGANYAVHRYGSLAAIDPKNKPGGYDDGGFLPPGEGGYRNGTGKPEPVLTSKQWADISTLANHVAQMVSADDLRGVNASRGAHIVVNNHQSYVYDSRNDFDGAQITVQAQDPDDMAVKIAAKAVTSRITQTRGVRR